MLLEFGYVWCRFNTTGAQEYYDSILELYASWGVDYIKVDDICVKYGRINDEGTLQYGGDEIEMLHRAIEKCGRSIVLSLSPGPAMVEKAEHLRKYANLWRITNDFWDSWEDIMEMFDRCNKLGTLCIGKAVSRIVICFRSDIFLSEVVNMD